MKIPSIDFNVQEPSKPSFYHIFHSPVDKVYNVFTNPSLFTKIFFQNKASIHLYKINNSSNNNNDNIINYNGELNNNISLDYVGAEFSFIYEGRTEYKFIVENVINLPYYKSFTHKNLSSKNILNTFGFLWDSADKTTIFHFTGEPDDPENILVNYIIQNKDSMCLNVDNFLMKTVKNLEENESITINCPINEVWDFVTDIKNQKYFYPKHKLDVFPKENDLIEVRDYDQKLTLTFKNSKKMEGDDTKYFI